MSRRFTLALLVVFASMCCWGCTSSNTPSTTADNTAGGDVHAAAGDAVGVVCGSCGEEKGSESCCSESAEKCEMCGKNKGSLLCCVELDEAVAGKDLCGNCGQVAGTDACCAEDAEKCECGMAKGSPLCCKLKKEDS